MTDTRLIGVDWGTSNLRALRLGDGGRVLEARADDCGASKLTAADFPAVLEALVGDWRTPGVEVLICGMAGARGKWAPAPYAPLPVGPGELARELVEAAPGVRVIPGAGDFSDGLQDLMRGEETQALGSGVADGLVLAPGTHSKWIGMDGGRVSAVRTYLTGELYGAVRAGTLLGEGMAEPGGDAAAFEAGVDRGLAGDGLSRALFSVRVGSLAGRLDGAGAADFLSGLLIGAELAGERALRPEPPRIAIVGSAGLAERYGRALARIGWTDWNLFDANAATGRGIWRIWEAAR